MTRITLPLAPRLLTAALVWLGAVGVSSAAESTIDIRDCGAVGDGQTRCTAAIQTAVDRCAAQGGGTVRLPAGRWLTGTVYLASNVTLVLDKDCTLLGSQDRDDYAWPRVPANADDKQPPFRYAAILAGSDLRNVAIRTAKRGHH